MSSINLTYHFLIAMPNMADPYFARTLTFVCEHSEQGALGIVVNRPLDMTLQALFERLSLSMRNTEIADAPIYFGGPVQTDRGFVLHTPPGNWQSTLRVRDRIGLTTSRDILEAVGRGEGPTKMLVSLGYAGWAAGQLEHELKQNAWLTVEAKDAIIFDLPAEERLPAALELLGLDYARLADVADMPEGGARTVLAFDFGLQRIGVAVGEATIASAHPLEPIRAASGPGRFAAVGRLVKEWNPSQLVVGRPLGEDGAAHEMTRRAERFARALEARFRLPVAMVDERYSSAEAESRMRAAYGSRRAARLARGKRLDSHAALVVLEQYFAERRR